MLTIGSVNISSGSTESAENSEKTTRASSRASTRTSSGSVGSTEDHTDLTQKTHLRFSQQTQGFSQIQLTQAFSQFQGSKMSNRIRAFAFIALGKSSFLFENLYYFPLKYANNLVKSSV